MLRLLLDANLSPRITAEIRRHRPDCRTTDLHEWKSGRYLEEPDDSRILEAAADEGLTLVTRDIRSIPPVLSAWQRAGRSHAGVIFLTPSAFPEGNVGAIVRALILLWDRERDSDFRDSERYLRPAALT